MANVVDWTVSKNENCRKLRDVAYVIPPQANESETESDFDSSGQVPLARLVKKYRQEGETPIDEDEISLMELKKWLKNREIRQIQNEETEVKDMECNDELSSNISCSLPLVANNDSGSGMEVNEIYSHQPLFGSVASETVRLLTKRWKKPRNKAEI